MVIEGFSALDRERGWERLGGDTVDLLVIGGGVTGAGIAFDAAGRGLSVAMVDAGDVASGTSSRSSRLVHGGLRYLETLDFDLVFEALRERRRLLELAPHLVHPLPFLFPVYAGDATGLAKLAAGMWLYEGLSLFRSPQRHRVFGRSGALAAEPNLRSDGLRGGALYYDAQVDDARLTLAIARAAAAAGAMVLTHAEVTSLELKRERIGAVRLRDAVGERELTARARLVINATGPWSDAVRRLADPGGMSRLRMTKGAHILVPRNRIGNRAAVIFRSAVDGRVMFILPWGDFTYVGTTDTEFEGDPCAARADAEDVRYLLDSANGIFPDAALTGADIVSTWAGVRPLLAPEPAERLSPSATSREHALWRDPSGLLNIAGGKLTTYRSMAAEATSRAATILSDEFDVRSGEFYTEFLSLPGSWEGEEARIRRNVEELGRRLGIEEESTRFLLARHGADAEMILRLVEESPELAGRVVPERPFLLAEIPFAIRHEMAVTLTDLFRRRIPIFYEAADGGVGRLAELVEVARGYLSPAWDEERVRREISDYASEVDGNRAGIT